MFYGKRTFRYFNRDGSGGRLDYIIKEGDFAIQISLRERGRSHARFTSFNSFYSWYKDIYINQRTFSEVITEGPQKFRIDIDEKVEDVELLYNRVLRILEDMGLRGPKVLLYDIETLLHVVLTNYLFPSHMDCNTIADILSEEIDIDRGVYKAVQHFRIEGCTKMGQRRWKRRMWEDVNLMNFHEGIISDRRGTKEVTLSIPRNVGRPPQGTDAYGILRCFKIRWKSGSMIALDRVHPSYCHQCCRVHDKENVYISRGKFHCWRKVSSS